MFIRAAIAALIGMIWGLQGCAENGSDDESKGKRRRDAGIPDASVTTDGDAPWQPAPDTGSDEGGMDAGDLDGGDGFDPGLGTDVDTEGCGNGALDPGETCDDGNSASGDGCAATCDAVEESFICPVPGMPCISTVVHGDGKIGGDEVCDDFNTENNDGCTAEGQLEDGWVCAVPGQKCQARTCGDGIIAGREVCDDGNTAAGDGCSDTCLLEEGWACGAPNTPCHQTVCNDGVREGMEPCDDGNNVVGDGCSPFCEIEPDCSAGACVSACGDGIILPGDNEACDDGNALNGDGCSDTCQVEPGFDCANVTSELPEALVVPITFRDFIALPEGDGVQHPDFQEFSGSDPTPDMVEAILGSDGKPVYTGICEEGNMIGPCPYDEQTTSAESFDTWYNDTPGVNLTQVTTLSLGVQEDGSYYFPDNAFFPWDEAGWVAAGLEQQSDDHNFGFTSEIRYWFEFKGGEYLRFSGDDDVWVFINGQLAVDLGGLHPRRDGEVTLDETVAAAMGLEEGRVYEIVLFHAERHTNASNFNLTLGGFTSVESTCESICGDGIVTGDEICDDGVNDGSYGSCLPDCTMGDYCGDGEVQEPFEACDDGVNLTVYSTTGAPGCGPGCQPGSYCGDGKVDSIFGEQCDDGVNTGAFGACGPGCTLGARCGDGIIQSAQGEVCDDGNTVSGDGCSSSCQKEGAVV